MQFRIVLFTLLLASCAPRAQFTALPPDRSASVPSTIFVGTTRTEEAGKFTGGRSDDTSFLRYDISIPKERESGSLDVPHRGDKPDPDQHFLVASETQFATETAFHNGMAKELKALGTNNAVVYVHGFNNTLAESVYRVAQMHHDLRVPGLGVHYAWPSAASALAYVYDRDSVLFARSGMEALLTEVAASGAREIVIVAHSMGAALTMEVLRQMANGGNENVMSRIKGVIVISPDIDVEVFRSQARDIGDLPQPFVIFGSSKDRVLGLSALISAADTRLGNLKDLDQIADLKVTYFDTTAFNVGAGHFDLGTSPALLSLFAGVVDIDRAYRRDARSTVGLLPGIVLTVQNATKVVLAPVVAIDEASKNQ